MTIDVVTARSDISNSAVSEIHSSIHSHNPHAVKKVCSLRAPGIERGVRDTGRLVVAACRLPREPN